MSTVPIEKIECICSNVVYTGDNGYSVVRYQFQSNKKSFIAVGTDLPSIKKSKIILMGSWVDSPKHGKQFRVDYAELKKPSNCDEMIEYLSALRVGIGKRISRRIYDTFGEESWNVVENDTERLISVPGITEKKIRSLKEKLEWSGQMKELFLYLRKFSTDVSYAEAQNVIKEYGNDAINIVSANPYALTKVKGFSFPKVDKIGLASGMSFDSSQRLQAAIPYLIGEFIVEGHLCVEKEVFLQKMQNYLSGSNHNILSIDTCKATVNDAARKKLIRCSTGYLYLPFSYKIECGFAEELCRLLYQKLDDIDNEDVSLFIEEFEKENGILLSESQKEAVIGVYENSVYIITGGPGTGKTMIIKAILYINEKLYDDKSLPLLLAPTGRAAKRMTESTQYPARTIHSAIGYNGRKEEVCFDGPLEENLIIVDEASMMGQYVAYVLVQKIDEPSRLVFVGDPNQLPSVDAGNVLAEMLRAGIPNICLQDIFRQAENSSIVTNAYRILGGTTQLSEDAAFVVHTVNSKAKMKQVICETYLEKVKEYGSDNVILLCPFRQKTDISVNAINKLIQNRINPYTGGKKITRKGIEFRVRDKVIYTKNTKSIVNGDIGRIVDIKTRYDEENEEKHQVVVVSFQGTEVEIEDDMLLNLDLAYCMTIHKSQGSEYQHVLIALNRQHRRLLKRNLIYTGVTRAKDCVMIFTDDIALDTAIRNHTDEIRNTLLGDRIHSLIEERKS